MGSSPNRSYRSSEPTQRCVASRSSSSHVLQLTPLFCFLSVYLAVEAGTRSLGGTAASAFLGKLKCSLLFSEGFSKSDERNLISTTPFSHPQFPSSSSSSRSLGSTRRMVSLSELLEPLVRLPSARCCDVDRVSFRVRVLFPLTLTPPPTLMNSSSPTSKGPKEQRWSYRVSPLHFIRSICSLASRFGTHLRSSLSSEPSSPNFSPSPPPLPLPLPRLRLPLPSSPPSSLPTPLPSPSRSTRRSKFLRTPLEPLSPKQRPCSSFLEGTLLPFLRLISTRWLRW